MAASAPGFAVVASKSVVSTLTTTYTAAPGGMNRSLPQHAIADTEAWTLFDCRVNNPDLLARRGPVAVMDSTASARAIGITRATNVDGTESLAQLTAASGGGSGSFAGFNGAGNATLAFSWPVTPGVLPYELFDASDALNGGVFVGSGSSYNNGTRRTLGLWLGARKNTCTATLSSAINVGDLTVSVASGGTSFGAGQFLFANDGGLVGVVKTDPAGNTITLVTPALHPISNTTTLTGTPVRGLNPRIATGTITTDTGSNEVNGGNTKFLKQAMNSGWWDIFTSTFTYVGTVSTVNSDAQLVLTGNAAVDMSNDDYIAIHQDGSYSMTADNVGFLNCSFGNHQFFAQGDTLYFSSLLDPEALDLTSDGDSLSFSSDPIRAIVPTLSSLVSISEYEAYALTGAIGTTPDRWRGDRIHDDGTFCGMSAVVYQGGALWAGKRGIWYWSGATPIDLAANLGNDYINYVSDATRAYGAVFQGHYFLFVEDGESGIFSKTKGSITTDTARLTFMINLTTGAVTILQGVELRGGIDLPSTVQFGTALYNISTTTNAAQVCLADSLFIDEGQDNVACYQGPPRGPDFYMESKFYDLGDPQRTKQWRIFLSHHNNDGGNLIVDTVPGLNSEGTSITTQLIDTGGAWSDTRLTYALSSQVLGMRVYQSTITGVAPSTSPASTNRVTLGPWALGYKLKRPGRV